MCRFTYYQGPPLLIASLVTEPENSLIHQSFKNQERSEPLNGDGFGVAWYPGSGRGRPGLFRSVTPAWNNSNLVRLAEAVESTCILAHVRAATQARNVSEANCHPFLAGRMAFMHNGDLGGFVEFRRAFLAELSDEAFRRIQGQTDSEHLFALFLDRLGEGAPPTAQRMAEALADTFAHALELSRRHTPGRHSYLNVVVTDGRCAVATRFTTDDSYDGESLYWNSGRRYVCEGNVCRMIAPEAEGAALLVSSERLSDDPGWESIPRNSMLLIEADRSTRIVPLAP